MTARLKDQGQFADRDEGEAARLLGVLSPSAPDAAMESRVYARLVAQPGRTLQRRWVVACVGLLLVSTTILAAALVHRWATKPHPSSPPAPMSTTELPASERPGAQPAGEPAHQLAEPATVQDLGASPPAGALPGAHGVPPRRIHGGIEKHRSAGPGNVAAKQDEIAAPETQAHPPVAPSSQAQPPVAPSSEARMAAAPSEESTMVLAALHALRRGHDPVKAGALLEQYLARFPRGVLVEEALALGIEAALDRKDAAVARRLAEQYVQHFPAGRFTGLARRATGSKAP